MGLKSGCCSSLFRLLKQTTIELAGNYCKQICLYINCKFSFLTLFSFKIVFGRFF